MALNQIRHIAEKRHLPQMVLERTMYFSGPGFAVSSKCLRLGRLVGWLVGFLLLSHFSV